MVQLILSVRLNLYLSSIFFNGFEDIVEHNYRWLVLRFISRQKINNVCKVNDHVNILRGVIDRYNLRKFICGSLFCQFSHLVK